MGCTHLFDGQDKGGPCLCLFFADIQTRGAGYNARELRGDDKGVPADDFDIARLQNYVRVWRAGVWGLRVCEALGCAG